MGLIKKRRDVLTPIFYFDGLNLIDVLEEVGYFLFHHPNTFCNWLSHICFKLLKEKLTSKNTTSTNNNNNNNNFKNALKRIDSVTKIYPTIFYNHLPSSS